MLGGAWFKECFGDADHCDLEHIANTAVDVVSRQLHISAAPVAVIPHVLKVCPLYSVYAHQSSV